MEGTPPGMPRPPYKEEGTFGPGGRKFVGLLIAIAVVVGIGVLALNVDFEQIADDLDFTTGSETTLDTTTTATQEEKEPQATTEAPAEPPAGDPSDPFSSAALAAALDALRAEVGAGADLVRIRADSNGIELDVRRGDEPVGYRWADGELSRLDFVVVVGSGTLAQRDFAASGVDPDSLGRLVRGAEREGGGRRIEPVNATLEPGLIDGRLRWLLTATAPNDATLSYQADPGARKVEPVGASGPPGAGLPPQAQDQLREAQKSFECIQEAGGDVDAIADCVEGSAP